MKRTIRNRSIALVAAAVAVAGVAGGIPAAAEEVEKRFRLSLSVGQLDTREVVRSDAANALTIVEVDDTTFNTVFEDPRDDSAALGQLRIRPAWRGTVTGQYAVNRFFLVEGSIGYQRGRVGDVEVQFQSPYQDISGYDRYRFTNFPIKAGDMEQVPIQVTAIARFRPKARLNPYLGAGAGYILVSFEPSGELNRLSRLLDNNTGALAPVASYPAYTITSPALIAADFADIDGASVSAPDSFEWHVVGGMEYSFRKRWVVYGDLRWQTASQEFRIGFNGSDSLGISVPNRRARVDSEWFTRAYGPFYLTEGLVDGGLNVNPDAAGDPLAPPAGPCTLPAEQCVFLINRDMADYNYRHALEPGFVPVSPDGELDPGYYYAKGGQINYGGFCLQIGVRFTF